MDYPMHPDLKIGNKFPNITLPDHTGKPQQLLKILRGFPGVLIFSRGYYCPKDRRQLTNYVTHLQPEFRVNYCKMITVSVDDEMNANEMRNITACATEIIRKYKKITETTTSIPPLVGYSSGSWGPTEADSLLV